MLFRRFIALTFLASLCLTARAGSFRVITLAQIPGLSDLEFIAEGEAQSLPISVSSFSPSYRIPATGQVALFDQAPEPNEQKAPLLTLQFPENAGNMIVLLKAVSTPQGPTYRYQLLDDSTSAFPAGSVYICNYMSEPVLIRLGKKKVVVEANQHDVVPLVSEEKPFNDGVAFAAEINGHGRVFSTSSWYLVSSMKIFCIIYQDDHGNPQIRRIRLT